MKISSAEFVKSATTIAQCPNLNLPEFAFFGRSNVWKSSLINMLTQKKTLAKCSNTPWKTRLFNFFIINNEWLLVDLPWYGYAKAWNREKTMWLDFSQNYLTKRETLKHTFLLIDWSIPPQKIDLEMIKSFLEEWIQFSIVFTKCDKSNQKERSKNQKLFKSELDKIMENLPIMFYVDNLHWKGRDEILDFIDSLL